jgi:hypothetical protein
MQLRVCDLAGNYTSLGAVIPERDGVAPAQFPLGSAGGGDTCGFGGTMERPGAVLDTDDVINASRIGRLQIMVGVLAALILVVNGYNVQVISYVAPQIARDWNIPREVLGWIGRRQVRTDGGLLIGRRCPLFRPQADRDRPRRVVRRDGAATTMASGRPIVRCAAAHGHWARR